MNVQTLRSACSRARPEAQRTGVAFKNYFRELSTSQSLAEDNAAPPNPDSKPSVRQRSRAATSEISSFVRKPGSPAKSQPSSSSGLQSASTSQPKVIIDVRSLPRGLGTRGRGTFGGRGRGQGQTGAGTQNQGQNPRAQSPAYGSRFSRPGGANAGRGSSLRGGRGGRGGARGGGGRAAATKGRRSSKDDADKDGKTFGKRQDPFEVMDPYEEQFDKDMRFGTKTTYAPSLTLDSLAAFAPAVPTSEAGRKATVLENLSALGTADPVGVPQDLQAASYAADLEAHGVRFFADSKAKDAAEKYLQQKEGEAGEKKDDVLVSGAEESVRKVIFEQAVMGEHERMTFSTEPAGVSRTWHLRAETWKKSDLDKFENKLTSLVGGTKIAKGIENAKGAEKRKAAEA
ncbi:hypothetical protein EsDP_00000375 [Epichloe bromicola]|uniref:Uncharacterized protein n=1 Tax=Epichloe bromicola TaxID=79588 RepID=A0ABQ0CEQ1_9HYPO